MRTKHGQGDGWWFAILPRKVNCVNEPRAARLKASSEVIVNFAVNVTVRAFSKSLAIFLLIATVIHRIEAGRVFRFHRREPVVLCLSSSKAWHLGFIRHTLSCAPGLEYYHHIIGDVAASLSRQSTASQDWLPIMPPPPHSRPENVLKVISLSPHLERTKLTFPRERKNSSELANNKLHCHYFTNMSRRNEHGTAPSPRWSPSCSFSLNFAST